MSFFARLLEMFTPSSPSQPGIVNTRDAVLVHLRCDECDELISLRIRKSSEIQREVDRGKGYDMYVNKTVVGNNCFNRMQLCLEFDQAYRVVNQELTGGSFTCKDRHEGA
ncbi:MAG: hypothetical protein GX316_10750 [Firmicutes bacterium]|nr:hypothetical protein [Bacillota bacterium]